MGEETFDRWDAIAFHVGHQDILLKSNQVVDFEHSAWRCRRTANGVVDSDRQATEGQKILLGAR